MKERPILFSAPMVRAILNGTKTQTRRVVKPQPPANTYKVLQYHHPDPRPHYHAWIDSVPPGPVCAASDWAHPCPYGQPGDRLWVRETFCPIYPQDPHYNGGEPIEYDYAATYRHGDRLGDSLGIRKVWKPSIHMPRGACRLELEITGVRVERLNDCSEADAIAEGIDRVENNFGNGPAYCDYRMKDPEDTSEWLRSPLASYRTLWERINGAGNWEANPWVWVVEFKRVDALKNAA